MIRPRAQIKNCQVEITNQILFRHLATTSIDKSPQAILMATLDRRRFRQQQGDGGWCVKTPIPTLHIHTWWRILTLITGLPKNAITSRSAEQGDARHRGSEAQPLNPSLGDLDRTCSGQASEIDQQWLGSLCGSLQDTEQMPLIRGKHTVFRHKMHQQAGGALTPRSASYATPRKTRTKLLIRRSRQHSSEDQDAQRTP